MKRLITAAVVIPLFYLYITKLPEGYFFGLLSAISLLGLYEFYRMFKLKKDITVLSIFLSLSILYLFYIEIESPSAFSLKPSALLSEALALSFIAISIWRMFITKDPSGSLRDISLAISGIIYIIFLMAFQLKLRKLGPEWILFLYGTVWFSDSSAYFIGTRFGRKKLYPQLSPNKTVEGAIGSVIGGIVSSYILCMVFLSPSEIRVPLILGIIIGAGCIIGDLLESMFKRDAGVKDSSNLIPGHGGILDKIDSSLVVAPLLYLYIRAL